MIWGLGVPIRKNLDEFVRQAAKNASYTSSDAVTDFLEALGNTG